MTGANTRRPNTFLQRMLRGRYKPTSLKRPLESSNSNNNNGISVDQQDSSNTNINDDDDAMNPTAVTSPQDDMTKTETNAPIREQATTVSPVGSTAATIITTTTTTNGVQHNDKMKDSSWQELLQPDDGGGDPDDANAPPRKRQRCDTLNSDSKHVTATTTTTSLPTDDDDELAKQQDAALKERRRKRINLRYYLKCHGDAPSSPSVKSRASSIPIIPLLAQQQRLQQQRLNFSQIMAVFWLAKLGQEYQLSLVMQSPMYRFLQLQLQRALPQQNIPAQEHVHPRVTAPFLHQQSSMLETQVRQLRKDFRKERTARLAVQKEHQKLLLKHKSLKTKYKKNYTYHFVSRNKIPAPDESPLTPAASTATTTVISNNDKTSPSESSQLVPRQLVHDYSPNNNKQQQHHTKSVPPKRHSQEDPLPTRLSKRNQTAREEASNDDDDAFPRMTNKNHPSSTRSDRNGKARASSKAERRAFQNKQVPQPSTNSTHSKRAPSKQSRKTTPIPPAKSTTPAHTTNHPQIQMPPPPRASKRLHQRPLPQKGETTTTSTGGSSNSSSEDDSRLDHHLLGKNHRVVPPPPPPSSSQASVGSSEATEWHKNHNQQQQQKSLHHYFHPAKENMDPKKASTGITDDTQATIATAGGVSVAPSVNLLADTDHHHANETQATLATTTSAAPSVNLLADTDHYHHHTNETQATIATSTSVARSVNLLADTADVEQNNNNNTRKPPSASSSQASEESSSTSGSSVQPSANLLEGTATEICHDAPTILPQESKAKSTKAGVMMEENHRHRHPHELECDDDPVEEESPTDTTILPSSWNTMPPPATPPKTTTFPTSLSRSDLPMDSPPAQEASQTTFHDGRTNEARKKGTLVMHPSHIRMPPLSMNPPSQKPSARNPREKVVVVSKGVDERPDHQNNHHPQRRRRVTLSPHTKPMQLSPFVSVAQQKNTQEATPRSSMQEKPRDSSSSRNTTNNNNMKNHHPPPATTRRNHRYYTGYAPNLYRQVAQAQPTPDDVPSDEMVEVPLANGMSRIFPGSRNSSGHTTNGGSVTSKAPEPAKKSPNTTQPTTTNAPPRKPSEQPWIKNRSYNDFMEDTPPSSRPSVPAIATRPKPQQQPYVRKFMGGGGVARPSKGNDEFRYQEVVRNKAARETMMAHDCPDCGPFLDQMERDGFSREDMRCTCRHKTVCTPPDTPPGFWELSFVDEIKQKKEEEEEEMMDKKSTNEEDGTVQDI